MIRVAGYIRVSTNGQAKDGLSLEYQKDQIKAFCSEQGYELVTIYEDAGISGAAVDEDDLTVDRPGMQELLADLKDSNIQYVVVLTTSRLWRSDFAKVLIQRELKRHGADVKAIDRPTYSIYNQDSDPSAFLINGMMELLDQYERLEVILKLKRGRTKKASKGGYAGGSAPLGYKSSRGSRVLTVDPEKVATVRRIFELSRKRPNGKKATLQFIADTLNEEGHTTAQGTQFQRVQVKRVLDNKEFYKGQYQYGGIESNGEHEPIL